MAPEKNVQQNQGLIDRFARLIIGGAFVVSTSYLSMPSVLVFILLIVGLYLMFSALVGHCILYRLLGISTNK